MLENPFWVKLCLTSMILFLAFCLVTWIFTLRSAASKVLRPGSDRAEQRTYLVASLVSPLVALIELFSRLFRGLRRIGGTLAIGLLVVLVMIASPALLVIYILYLFIRYGSDLGEALLERTVKSYRRGER